MPLPIEKPKFISTGFLKEYDNPSGSFADHETYWLSMYANIGGKVLGTVSIGHRGISLARYIIHSHVFVPKNTPFGIVDKITKYTNNIHFFGNNYTECYLLAAEYMTIHGIVNVSQGQLPRYFGDVVIANKALQGRVPKCIFVPTCNFDLVMGIAEGMKTRGHNIDVIACVLPDHPLSPRYNTEYNHTPYYTGIKYSDYKMGAGFNDSYKAFDNIKIATIKNPDHCYRRYHNLYPYMDAMCYVAMEVSEGYTVELNEKKLVVLHGGNLIERIDKVD